MKKLVVFCAAMLCSFLAFSQEAEFSVVPRLEVNKTGSEYGLGSSSLYTFLDGSFGENFSYSVSNHWLSTDTGSLYSNSFVVGEPDWVDWAYLTYSVGSFYVSAGKVALNTGGFEFYENDVDVFDILASTTWNESSVYSFGATIGFTPWENTCFELQYSQSGASIYWNGEYGPFSNSWAYSHNTVVGYDILGLGNRLSFDKSTYTLDIFSHDWSFLEAHVEAQFDILRNMSVSGIFNCTNDDYRSAGLKMLVFPFGSELLRVHALAAYDNLENFSFSLGMTFNFNFEI